MAMFRRFPRSSLRTMRGMAEPTTPTTAGALWPAVLQATERARAAGALHSFDSEQHVIADGGVRFVVRKLTRAARAEFAARRREADASVGNPFLPHDPNLFVADLPSTHVVLLNKFNLLPHHLVIVTREFRLQETLLDANDFAAMRSCLAEIDGLMFYNGGEIAGASQRHKHLQMVPIPLDDGGRPMPIEALIERVQSRSGVFTVPGLAFRHACTWLAPDAFAASFDARALVAVYEALLAQIGVQAIMRDGDRYQSAPWNLLVTRRWMLAIPRTRPDFLGVQINAIGFAGSLYVRDDAQLATVKRVRPMAVLSKVTRDE
jgi:sulfate adenylyltransferase (ADP) / ATP adenylyltransferase